MSHVRRHHTKHMSRTNLDHVYCPSAWHVVHGTGEGRRERETRGKKHDGKAVNENMQRLTLHKPSCHTMEPRGNNTMYGTSAHEPDGGYVAMEAKGKNNE